MGAESISFNELPEDSGYLNKTRGVLSTKILQS